MTRAGFPHSTPLPSPSGEATAVPARSCPRATVPVPLHKQRQRKSPFVAAALLTQLELQRGSSCSRASPQLGERQSPPGPPATAAPAPSPGPGDNGRCHPAAPGGVLGAGIRGLQPKGAQQLLLLQPHPGMQSRDGPGWHWGHAMLRSPLAVTLPSSMDLPSSFGQAQMDPAGSHRLLLAWIMEAPTPPVPPFLLPSMDIQGHHLIPAYPKLSNQCH